MLTIHLLCLNLLLSAHEKVSVKTGADHTNILPTKRALNEQEASAYIGMSTSWLRHGRIEGNRSNHIPKPAFIKIGRSVRYLIGDLDAWLEKFQKFDHLAQLLQKESIYNKKAKSDNVKPKY